MNTHSTSPNDGQSILNDAQENAVRHGDGPLLIIAGAGTGKTTVITERIKYLIAHKNVLPEEILALTFTEKASLEMEKRVDESLPYGVTQLWISTFHSFCDRVLRNEGVHIGIDPDFALMTQAETLLFVRSNIFSFDFSYFRPLGNPTKFVHGLLQHFSRLQDEDISPQEYLEFVKMQNKRDDLENQEKEKLHELANGYKAYEELKVKHSVFDYGDLISKTLRLFRSRPNVLKQYHKKFKYVLIDEFQDTNIAQNELARLLVGKKQNITVVGDDDQAIYRFRGAAVSNIIQFRQHYPKTAMIVLNQNYRSTKSILDVSYELIQKNNPDRLEHIEQISKQLESMRRKEGKHVRVQVSDRVEDEAEYVSAEIEQYVDSGGSYKDIAILVRANNHADPFMRSLSRRGIPYQFLGPGKLFRQNEIKDLIAYLKLLYDIRDTVACFRVISMEWLGISSRDIAFAVSLSKSSGISLFESCELLAMDRSDVPQSHSIPEISSDSKKGFTKFIALVHRHLELIKSESAGQILYYFLQDTGLLQELASIDTKEDETRATNTAKFFDKLKTFESDHEDASVYAVVDWIELSMRLGESPAASDSDWQNHNAVNILTIHSSKGLEFPVVFLVNLVSGRFPTNRRKEQIPIPEDLIKEQIPSGDFHIQEERRLFYVGLTRAKDRLFLTAAKFYGAGKREKKLSPFIEETVGPEALTEALSQPAGETKQLPLLAQWEKVQQEKIPPKKKALHYISFSQFDTYKRCPLQYKYRYVLKIPVPTSAALTFGSTMHAVVQAFYEEIRRGIKPSKIRLLQLLDEKWKSVGYKNRAYEDKMKAHGKELLDGYYEHGFDPSRIPSEIEFPFRIKISDKLTLGGKIDRVDMMDDGSVEIIDYKTGQAPKRKDSRREKQLTMYALAACDEGVLGKNPEEVYVSFYYFESQQKITVKKTQKDLDGITDDIKTTVDEIERSDFTATPGRHCDFCEYRLICDAWSS